MAGALTPILCNGKRLSSLLHELPRAFQQCKGRMSFVEVANFWLEPERNVVALQGFRKPTLVRQ